MKKLITLRLDEEVIEWFRSGGEGYQTRMNDALRSHMDYEGGKSALDNVDLREAIYDYIPDKIDNIISKVSINTSSAQDDYFKPMPKKGK